MADLTEHHYSLFRNDCSKALRECNNLKKQGNRCYRSEDYFGAIREYNKGIQTLKISRANNEGNAQIHKLDKSLAQLHGNRSECWFKLQEVRKCLDDAKKNVDYYPEWYKGHMRVGRAYRELGKFNKSLKALVQGYIRLASDAEDLKKKVLYELIETAFVIKTPVDYLLTVLQNVPASLRAHVINFYLENKDWNIAKFIVTKVWQLTDSDLWRPKSSSDTKWDVDLLHFCDRDLLRQHRWLCKALHYFLMLKSDHHQLKFHPGDTYFHATITIVVQSWRHAQQTQEEVSYVHNDFAVGGHDGINADVDHESRGNADATELLHYVVENIVIVNGDLNIEDDNGNTVLHHLATFDIYPTSVMKYILSKDIDCFKMNKDGKTALDQTSQPEKRTLLLGKVVAQLVAETDKHNAIEVPEDRRKLKAKNIKTLSHLLSVFIKPVILKELLKISADSFKDLLTSLADAGKWLVLKELVTEFKEAKRETTLPTFAKEISLIQVVEATGQELTESDKIDLVHLLVSHEASLDSPEAILASIRNEEWKLTKELLDLGVNCDGVTLGPGESPYHADIQMALNKPLVFEEAAAKTNIQSKPSEEESIDTKISTLLSKIPDASGFLNPAQASNKFLEPGLLDSDDDTNEEVNSPDGRLGDNDSNGLPKEEVTQADIDELSRIGQVEVDPNEFDNLMWDMECTESVWRTLIDKKQATVDIGSRKLPWRNLVLIKLKQLGSGDWENLKQRHRKDVPKTLRLYSLRLTSTSYILWERAIAFSSRLSNQEISELHESQESAIQKRRVYAEHIRVWEIGLNKSDLKTAVAKVAKSHQRGRQCVVKKYLKRIGPQSSQISLPQHYIDCIDQPDGIQLVPPASLQDNEFTILKLYMLSSQMVEAVLNDVDIKVDFPFRVTEIEHTFINLKPEAPLLLLGRSGTGKTTCCLYRLFQEFMEYWKEAKALGRPNIQCLDFTDTNFGAEIAVPDFEGNDGQNGEVTDENDNNYEHLHQIFVTKNPVLCKEVESNFIKLCQTPKWLCDHLAQRAVDIPNRLQDMEDNSFPLFLTSRHLLLILDASVDGEAFFPRDEDLGMKLYIPGWEPQENIFSIGQPQIKRIFQNAGRANRKEDPRRESTYGVFAREIWPKIKKKRNFHPSLVWTEIVSFIKGSYEALECHDGYLDMAKYISIGRKRAPNFDNERPFIYEIFLRYKEYLKAENLFDEADVVYHIYGRLKKTQMNIYWSPHNIYIDETQDFSQAELALLVSLCRFPNQMFLAGDTAQSIMRGVSFRFADLKSIFFHKTHHKLAGQTQVKMPDKIRQLRHNYRSHTGILDLASAVLDIILDLFPETIDKLEKDQGMFDGPKPVIIETCKTEFLARLLKGNKRDTTHIEFGAHQAILVVNDEAKNNVPSELNDGFVLTIYESKGLEFDDILIYNFFKYSQASEEWRVVTSFLNDLVKRVKNSKNPENKSESLVVLNQEVLQQQGRPRPLTFDKHLHKLLDTDLKQLYTAVTRARVNVWIFDEDAEKRAPMFEYFKALNLVKILDSEDADYDSGGKGFMETSTPQQWRQAGDKHMEQKKYELAATCYKKANKTRLEQLAKAFLISEEAAMEAKCSVKKGKLLYLKAGAQFLQCKAMELAVKCFQQAQANKHAAFTLEKLGMFEDASNEYKLALDLDSATKCLEQIGYFKGAIGLWVDNEQFAEAVNCLHRYQELVKTFEVQGQAIPEILVKNKPREEYSENNLLIKLAEFQYKKKQLEAFHQTVAKVTDKQKKISLLKRMEFWKEAAELLHDEGSKEERKEAVHLMMRIGQLDKALEFAKEGFFKPLRAAIHISMGMSYSDDLKAKENLTAAQTIYNDLEDHCGQGLATLLLGKCVKELKYLRDAYKLFDDPISPHLPGRLESFAAMAELSNEKPMLVDECRDFITNVIGLGLELVKILNGHKNNQWQQYMRFYGLELDVTNQKLMWYPSEQPLYKKIHKGDGSAKFISVDITEAVKALTLYTVDTLKGITRAVRRSLLQLKEQKSQKITCKTFHEELKCEQTSCRSQHNYHSNKETDMTGVLSLLSLNVELDHSVSLASEKLESFGMADLKPLLLEEVNWKSVETLLKFLVPSRPHPDTETQQIMKLIANVRSSKETMARIERYFSSRCVDENTPIKAREMVTSTCWMTKALFWSNLLHLDMLKKVTSFETQLNQTLTNNIPENLASLGLYQSKDEPDGPAQIHFAGSLFVQSFHEICSAGDMHSSTNLFIDTMKLIAQGGQGMRLSFFDLEYIIFWMEFHFCVSIFTLANENRKAAFYLPKSFLSRVNLVNACIKLPDQKGSGSTVQQLVKQGFQLQADNIETQEKLINVLVGTENSTFSLISFVNTLFNGNNAQKLLAEQILTLTLVALLNIPNNYVQSKFEVQMRKFLFKVDHKVVPKRLKTLVNEIKKGKRYSDIARSLTHYFSIQKHNELMYCTWQSQYNYPLSYKQLNISKFSNLPFYNVDLTKGDDVAEVPR